MRLTSKVGIERGLANIPWVAWTPTYSTDAGTFGSITTLLAQYRKVGKLVFFACAVVINNIGTASGNFIMSPPPFAPVDLGAGVGREVTTTGKMLVVYITPTLLYVVNYDQSYPTASGSQLQFSGWYRTT